MFQSPGAVFYIADFAVHYYSICIALGIICGAFASYYVTKKYYPYLNIDIFYEYTPIIILSAILCARIYYVFIDWNFFSNHLSEIPMLWHGGVTIHGAIFGGVLAGFIKARIEKVSFLKYCDAAPWGVLVGQILGRWGNFFNSEAFGTPTDLPWKLYIAPSHRPVGLESFSFFHPTFLYESLWNILIFLLLFFFFRKFYQQRGIYGGAFFTYLLFYSIGRILIEGIRTDTVSYIRNIPVPTLICLITIAVSIFFLVYIFKNKEQIKNY